MAVLERAPRGRWVRRLAAAALVASTASGQTNEHYRTLEPPDLIELTGHVGRPTAGETGGWEITLGAGLSPTVRDFHLTGMRILNSGRLPLSVLAQLEPYRPTLFVFGRADQLAALAAASPRDTVVLSGYRRIGSRNLLLTGLRIEPPATPMPTAPGID